MATGFRNLTVYKKAFALHNFKYVEDTSFYIASNPGTLVSRYGAGI